MNTTQHLENLKHIKKWLKGKNLPEAEKDILRGLINLKVKEYKEAIIKAIKNR